MTNALGTLLRSARNAKHLTQAQVGEHAGVTYAAVGQYETGRIRQPKPEKVAAIAALLDIPREKLNAALAESYGFTIDEPSRSALPQPSTAPRPQQREVEADTAAPTLSKVAGLRDVPELGIAVGGEDGDFTLNGETLDYVLRPTALATRDVFAVRVKNDSMSPRFDEGHLLYVERRREPKPGEDAIVELWPEQEDAAGPAFIKQVVSKSMATVVVRQFNPPRELTFERSRIKALYRVVPNNELFGV